MLVKQLTERADQSLNGVFFKRYMLKVVGKAAYSVDPVALVMGDRIDQVSSQSIRNLQVIDRATESVVFRPLITTGKQ